MVSQYDAYLGDLVRNIFQIRPELFHSVERQMPFSEIMEYPNLDEVKERILEKEVESILRESHLEQLKILERKVSTVSQKGFTLTSNLPILSTFIEITERRNLFVHTNGIITKQYIDNCEKNGVHDCDKMKVGDRLKVTPTYFHQAYEAIFEMGVKLGHVLWRKFVPDSREQADGDLNSICFDLIVNDQLDLAIELLTFATDIIKSHHNDRSRKVFIINKALAYYLQGKTAKMKKVLATEDWSIGDTFKLAIDVLNEDFEGASNMMKKLGKDHDEVKKDSYKEWPLFKFFRETELFKNTFLEIFGEEFVYKKHPEKAYVSFLKRLDSPKQSV